MNLTRDIIKSFAAIALISTALPALATPAASYYIYDESGHVIGEYDTNGNPVQEHIYLGDKPVAVVQGGTVDNVATDQLNTPRAVMDASKNVIWSWNSDPFGNGQPTGSLTYNLRFPGQYYDQENGHNYNYFRDYDSDTDRYIESDPIGLDGGGNTYIYADDNAIYSSDETGLAPSPLPPYRVRTRPCNSDELYACTARCSKRGVESCRVSQTFRVTRIVGNKALYEWIDGPMSCSCNPDDDDCPYNKVKEFAALFGLSIPVYLAISESLRLIPIRNAVPVP